MTIYELLQKTDQAGIDLRVEGRDLRWSSRRPGAPPDSLLQAIRARKREVLRVIGRRTPPARCSRCKTEGKWLPLAAPNQWLCATCYALGGDLNSHTAPSAPPWLLPGDRCRVCRHQNVYTTPIGVKICKTCHPVA